jgi:hypothetical protein
MEWEWASIDSVEKQVDRRIDWDKDAENICIGKFKQFAAF